MDLELATVDELVAELMKRTTFQGLVLRRPGDFKGQWTPGSNPFQLSYNNLELGEAQRLLVVVSDFIQCGPDASTSD